MAGLPDGLHITAVRQPASSRPSGAWPSSQASGPWSLAPPPAALPCPGCGPCGRISTRELLAEQRAGDGTFAPGTAVRRGASWHCAAGRHWPAVMTWIRTAPVAGVLCPHHARSGPSGPSAPGRCATRAAGTSSSSAIPTRPRTWRPPKLIGAVHEDLQRNSRAGVRRRYGTRQQRVGLWWTKTNRQLRRRDWRSPVDPCGPRKAAAGPFGGTIAHGMLTVSVVPAFLFELYDVDSILMAINYGLE